MFRSLVGFAGVAIVAFLALRLLSGLFGIVFGLFWTLVILAFWGFVVYLVLRVFAPGLADRLRDTIRGNKTA
jgi:hypothetical protein